MTSIATYPATLLRRVRRAAKINRGQLAERSGIKAHTVGRIERGKDFRLGSLRKIARCAGHELAIAAVDTADGSLFWGTPGELIRHCRRAARLSQPDLSCITGVTQGLISETETDLREPGHRQLKRLLRACRYKLVFAFVAASTH